MADIELVIKIDENTYHRIQTLVRDDYFEHDICGYSMQRIANSTPLPKGHGRLIDADKIQFENTEFDTYGDYSRAFDAIDQADTIIEADKEESVPWEKWLYPNRKENK